MKKMLAGLIGILALSISSFAVAGHVGGPREESFVLAPNTEHSWTMLMKTDQTLLIRVVGDGDGDLDCWLYDSQGNLILADESLDDGCRFTGIVRGNMYARGFILRVRNNGGAADQFTVVTN